MARHAVRAEVRGENTTPVNATSNDGESIATVATATATAPLKGSLRVLRRVLALCISAISTLPNNGGGLPTLLPTLVGGRGLGGGPIAPTTEHQLCLVCATLSTSIRMAILECVARRSARGSGTAPAALAAPCDLAEALAHALRRFGGRVKAAQLARTAGEGGGQRRRGGAGGGGGGHR